MKVLSFFSFQWNLLAPYWACYCFLMVFHSCLTMSLLSTNQSRHCCMQAELADPYAVPNLDYEADMSVVLRLVSCFYLIGVSTASTDRNLVVVIVTLAVVSRSCHLPQALTTVTCHSHLLLSLATVTYHSHLPQSLATVTCHSYLLLSTCHLTCQPLSLATVTCCLVTSYSHVV